MTSQDPRVMKAAARLLVRGESVIASTGLGIALILMMVLAGAGAWLVYTQRMAAEESSAQRVQSLGRLLAAQAEPLLAGEKQPQLQVIVRSFAAEHELVRCRVVDGERVIADGTMPAVRVRREGEAAPEPVAVDPGVHLVSASAPVGVESSGVRVELAGRLMYPEWAGWESMAGLGGIAAVGLLAFLFVYRHLRARLRAIGAIREALLAMERGETATNALSVSGKLGAEATAWNQLLADRERLQKDLLSERARESFGQRGDLKQDLAQACDALWQGLLLVDEDLSIKYCNGAAAVFLRARRETLPGTSFAEHISDAETVEAVRSVAKGEVRRKTTLELRRAEGEHAGVLRMSVRPVRREDAAAAVIVIEDITQQRVADEARNAFVAHATHELRTPLTNIRLYVEQAIELGESDKAQRAKCLNVINQESRRLERIVGDMLSVSEIEAGSFKLRSGDVRLDAVFEELHEDYRAQAEEKKIKLAFDLPPKMPVIQGDRDKIMLALHNLVGNALKYTPEGGEVTVRMTAGARELAVEVQDSGIGIAPEECELIFERFYRSQDQRLSTITGTGLGLSIAREVVRLHGGDISVRSQLNQGSTFTLTIPVLAEAA